MLARRIALQATAATLAAPALAIPGTAMAASGDTLLPWQDNLQPVIVEDGVRFDLPGVRIGTAEYREGPTGCNVFHFPEGATCEIDARGGSPGLFNPSPRIEALFLSGGSLYGLEVGIGIAGELFAQRRKAVVGQIALVTGAIIFDYVRRTTLVFPDKRLGAAAFRAAQPGRFPIGARGAGCSASIGQLGSGRFAPEAGGQGCAIGNIGDATIGVFTVLNPLGAIFDRNGQLLRGYVDRETGVRRSLDYIIANHPAELSLIQATAGSHTTITAVIIDREVPAAELRQFGRQIHASMAQAIRPFHTPFDGDVLFAVSTGRQPLGIPAALAAEVGTQLALQAIYSAIPA